MKKPCQSSVRRLSTFCAAVGLSLSAASVRADVQEETLLNPNDPSDVWGKRITGLGENGDEVALVFTNTAHTTNDPMRLSLPVGVNKVWYLLAGGGGSGGASASYSSKSNKYYTSGGGGAGGLVESNDCAVASRDIAVVVGAGGAAVSVTGNTTANVSTNGISGGHSYLAIGTDDAVVAHGGGGGGGIASGLKGGSGGGSGTSYSPSAGYSGGACYEGEGNVGGSSAREAGGGGGGGAGGAGTSRTSKQYAGGPGGAGGVSAIGGGYVSKYKKDGNEYYCAGGGGGGYGSSYDGGAGGTGGGGKGAKYSTSDSTAGSGTNYGCGGGGTFGAAAVTTRTSGAGYQGVVIVRYTQAANVIAVPGIASKVYTGSTQTADVPENVGYTITENQGGENVGGYPVVLTLNDGYTWEDGTTHATNLTFTITQAQNEWTAEPTIDPASWYEKTTPGTLTAAETKFGAPVATIAKDGGEAVPFVALPDEVGEYVLTYTSVGTDNYLAPADAEKSVSFTVISSAVTPDFAVAFDGDIATGVVTAAVPFRVTCETTTTKTADITAKYALDGSYVTNETLFAAGVALNDGAGVGVLQGLLPGKTYWVALYGASGEKSTNTAFRSFATIDPVADITTAYTFDATNFIITGSAQTHIGTTTVTLHYSVNSEACGLTMTAGPFEVGTTNFEFRVPFESMQDKLTWYATFENTYGETTWTKATEVKTDDCQDKSTVTYTWQGGETGAWCDVANWTASKSPAYGYPCNEYGKAKFPNTCTNVTVDLGGKTIEIYEAASASGLTLQNMGVLTIENGSLNIGPDAIGASNCKRVCLRNGGKVYTTTGKDLTLFKEGGGCVLELAGNATVGLPTTLGNYSGGNTVLAHGTNNVVTSQMRSNNSTSTVSVWDGTLRFDTTLRSNPSRALTLSVSNATVSANYFYLADVSSGNKAKMVFDLFVPSAGLTEAPVQARTLSSNGKFNDQTQLKLAFDNNFAGGTLPLFQNVQFDTGAFAAFTNSVTITPARFAGKTTFRYENNNVYADVEGMGFMFIVK